MQCLQNTIDFLQNKIFLFVQNAQFCICGPSEIFNINVTTIFNILLWFCKNDSWDNWNGAASHWSEPVPPLIAQSRSRRLLVKARATSRWSKPEPPLIGQSWSRLSLVKARAASHRFVPEPLLKLTFEFQCWIKNHNFKLCLHYNLVYRYNKIMTILQ